MLNLPLKVRPLARELFFRKFCLSIVELLSDFLKLLDGWESPA